MNYARSEPVSGQAAERLDSEQPQIALPRVSVIVTCFNYARYVGHALDSVAAQTYGNFDCVVVDDASTDDSALLIQRWIDQKQDPRFRFMPNPSNRGQTGSFTVGLAATSSEFVAFLDADDFWFPQFLQRHVEAHLNRLLSTSLSCSDLIQVDEERRVLSGTMSGPVFRERATLAYPSIEADRCIQIDPSAAGLTFAESPGVKCIQPSYSEHPWTATSGMMFRRSALDMIMPKNPDELRICTDWYMFVLCHYLTGSLAIGSALGAYRRHGNNNFASNLIMGSGLPSTPSMLMRQHKTVISVMLNHLISQYDRLATVFPGSDVGRLVRILVTKALREDIPIQDNRLRELLGTRGMLEARLKARLTFFRRLRTLLR